MYTYRSSLHATKTPLYEYNCEDGYNCVIQLSIFCIAKLL